VEALLARPLLLPDEFAPLGLCARLVHFGKNLSFCHRRRDHRFLYTVLEKTLDQVIDFHVPFQAFQVCSQSLAYVRPYQG
jgi:hypothetical protein